MNESIIQVPLYTSTAAWRRDTQLRGLLRNHPSVLASSGPLAARGTLFSAARLALHNTDAALAVGLSPIGSGGSIGLMAIDGPNPTLDGAARMRWLDMPGDAPLSSLDWCDGLLLAGTTRGRVLLSAVDPQDLYGGDNNKNSNSSNSNNSGPLKVRECLTAYGRASAQCRVGGAVVSPVGPAASTMVRSAHCNAGVSAASVVAAVGCDVCVWDAASGRAEPVAQWTPRGTATAEGNMYNNRAAMPMPLLVTQWAPRSDAVILSGDAAGRLLLSDMRVAHSNSNNNNNGSNSNNSGSGNGVLCLPAPRGGPCAVRCADFNALLPFVLAAGTADGTISVYDCRAPKCPVRTVPSLQGDAGALRWLRLHTDLIASGGTDGSVALWGLRAPPTYRIGRAQYGAPLSDLAATTTFVEQRVFGVTCAGELTLTGLSRDALIALAPEMSNNSNSNSNSNNNNNNSAVGASPCSIESIAGPNGRRGSAGGGGGGEKGAADLLARHRFGCGLLYARHLREAYEVIADCAMEYFAQRNISVATALMGLVDVVAVPLFDYGGRLRDSSLARAPSHTYAVQRFDELLLRTSARLCMTLPLDRIRALSRPNAEDLRKLEALRLNTLLQGVLQSGDASAVFAGLQLFSANAGNLELIDSETACGIASLLLRDSFTDGERFVRALLALLMRPDGSVVARPLARRLLLVAQEPHVTLGAAPREVHRREERFLRHFSVAREAVEVQLTILRLGIEHHREVIAEVNAYQRRCLERKRSGIFGWLAVKPLLLFLHCLTADSNYATFLWASVQLIGALARCPAARQVEDVLSGTVDRIGSAAGRLRAEMQQAAETVRFTPPMLRAVAKSLETVHEFLAVLLRVQFECENVAIESKMPQVPPLMARIFDALSSASADLLVSWAALLQTLAKCKLREFARKTCAPPVRSFARRVEGLMGVSSKKEEDETLNEVLDTCEEFLNAVIKREENTHDDDDDDRDDDGEDDDGDDDDDEG